MSSSPVVPEEDPTLLFTNAGMNQFKDMLLGHEVRDYKRAVSVQKCIRAGGKHNDLDDVGKDARHLTLFEMLGNWSFGDYYKRKSIEWAWDFVTNQLKLDTSRLYVTVHHTDDESHDIWVDDIGIAKDHMLRLGDKDNFWSMGPVGPCGPCSEIHYDSRPQDGEMPFVEGYDDDRIIEIWNLVFMESNRQEDGSFEPLPMQSVDTGMGMDRVAMILNNRHSVFHTELFSPLFVATLALLGTDASSWERDEWTAFYERDDFEHFAVIADHTRMVMFALCDGAQFSNEGRGYVLRRVLRRAVRHGRELGFETPFMFKVAKAVIETYGTPYPEIQAVGHEASKLVELEEERFFRNLERGITIFEQAVEHAQKEGRSTLSSQEVFDLYATSGFPTDLTQIMAQERGLDVDLSDYKRIWEEHRDASRGKDLYADAAGLGQWETITTGSADNFVGYSAHDAVTQLRKIRITDDGDVEFTLATTPFYAESGGQVGDKGTLSNADGSIVVHIKDVQKAPIGFIHKGSMHVGDARKVDWSGNFDAHVDVSTRALTMSNHTATHLLHAALRDLVSDKVSQAGSLVNPSKLRFDFTHGAPLTTEELRAVEDRVNAQIRAGHVVTIHADVERDIAVTQMGAMAIFGEKYGDVVRVVDIPGESVELCGGTHVANTREIGLFRIESEAGVAAGIRRIEAITGEAAYVSFQSDRDQLGHVAQTLKTQPAALVERATSLLEERSELERQLRKMTQRMALLEVDQIIEDALTVGDVRVVAQAIKVDTRDQLMAYADRLRQKMEHGVVLLGAEVDGKAALLCMVAEDVFKGHKLKAGDLINDVAAHVGGRGGGRPTLAQAGGSNPAGIPDAIAGFEQAVRARLS